MVQSATFIKKTENEILKIIASEKFQNFMLENMPQEIP